jgi:hypothetical protein
MKNKIILSCIATMLFILVGFQVKNEDKTTYKCMIQMANYSGEGAYVIVSLLDKEGNYVETLYVQGDDDEWYSEISDWWRFQGKHRRNIDAITGATIRSGQRAINRIEIPNDTFNKGYTIRFETAVEDKEYFNNDIEIELSSVGMLQGKIEGKGYIRYVRLIPQF